MKTKDKAENDLSPLVTAAVAAAAAGGTYLWWQKLRAGEDQGQQAPGPAGLPFLGNLPQPGNDQMNRFAQLRQRFGDVVRLQVGPRTLHLLSHPDFARYVLQDNNRNYIKSRGLEKTKDVLGEGLLTSEGEFWRRQRRLIQPIFHRQKIATFAETMTAATAEMLEGWEAAAAGGDPIDIAQAMMHLTLDIVSKTLFSTALTPAELDTVGEVMTPILHYATERIGSLFDFTDEWPTPANRRERAREAKLDDIVYRIIGERRRSGDKADDLLGLLMAAQDEETGEGMTDKQLRDEVMTIFLAGHETTANLLAFTWTLLSHHVGARQRLQAEVDRVLEGRTPDAADVPALSYTNMIIDEALRLYPPAWVIGRQPLADDEIGGYPIPAGSTVLISIYNIHRHPDFWENPEGFNPERFTPERKRERNRYAFIPFGGGPRLCIGEHFALTEAALVVAMVTQRYELNLLPGHPVAPEAAFTLRPEGPIWMTVHPRTPPVSP